MCIGVVSIENVVLIIIDSVKWIVLLKCLGFCVYSISIFRIFGRNSIVVVVENSVVVFFGCYFG